MRQIKEPWDISKRYKFESRLGALGWRCSRNSPESINAMVGWFFTKDNLTILTDDWGIWIYEDGRRLFGLSDEYVDKMIFDQLGPLCQNPFSGKKRYLWLNMATSGYTTKRMVRRETNGG